MCSWGSDRAVLLELDRVACRVGDEDLADVALRGVEVRDGPRVELADRGIDVVDEQAEVRAGRVDPVTGVPGVHEVQLDVADPVPVPTDAGDLGAVTIIEAEDLGVEAPRLVERAVDVHAHVADSGHPHRTILARPGRPAGVPAWSMAVSFVPFGADTWRDPHPIYRALRDDDPVHWSAAARCYVLTRFDDVFRAARDTDTFSSAQGLTFTNEIEALGLAPTIVMMDPPDHTRFRRLVSRGFTPRQVHEIEPGVRQFVNDRLDELLDERDADFIAGLAAPLPCFVVGEYLGVSADDRAQFARWTHAIVGAGTEGHDVSVHDALAGLYGFFTEQIERRRVEPGDDMISTLVAADDGSLEIEEILGYAFVMVAGGNDTTIGLLGGGAELLTEHPDQRRRLVDDPPLIPNAIDECLRLTSPVQGLCRVATREVTLHDTTITPGSRVLLCYGSANRDPREFGDDADQMDVAREITRFLSFSSGPHFCLGAAAARLQGQVVFEELLRRCPDFSVDAAAGRFADGAFTRRYDTLPFAS